MIGASGALGSVPVVFVTLITCIILLCLRTWIGESRIVLVRRVALLVTGSTVFLLALFLFVVFIRFKTLA
jgi:hypothetical protein